MPLIGEIVLPGDTLPDVTASSTNIIVGPGIKKEADGTLLVIRPGILREKITTEKDSHAVWVDTRCKQYVPVKGNRVIGLVLQKFGEGYRVDIGAAEPGYLSNMAFEGGSKKKKPLEMGDLVFCQILVAVRDMEPELVCVDSVDRARGMGKLPVDGYVFEVPLHVTRKILSEKCNLLSTLKSLVSFEGLCGDNGRIYVKSGSLRETIVVVNSMILCEYMSNEQIENVVPRILEKSKT